jgi:hypothetical protein
MRILASLLLLFALAASAIRVSTNLTDHRVYVNGKPFYFKGINYLPIPIGHDPWNIDPFDDPAVVDRDVPKLKAMGVNTVRIHHFQVTNPKSKLYLLDKLYENEIFAVICLTFNSNDQPWADPVARDTIKNRFLDLVRAYGKHPAVLMWIFGNELNQPTKFDEPNAFSLLKEVKDATHALEGPDNWHPVTTAFIDVKAVNAAKAYSDCVDVWAIQSYRGLSFFTLINEFSSATNLPVVMTEFGVDAYNNITQSEDQDMQVSGSTLLFNELAMYSKQNKITGGFFFQYADVWWKFGSPLVQDHHGWKAGGFPDKVANEEWWGVFTLSPGSPNVLTPRKMFTALADLHKNAHPYGYIASYLDTQVPTSLPTADPTVSPSSDPSEGLNPTTPASTTTTSTSPKDDPAVQIKGSNSSSSSSKTGYIVGGAVVGGIVVIAGAFLIRKRLVSKKSTEKGEENHDDNTENAKAEA